jgi:hypothetical protein
MRIGRIASSLGIAFLTSPFLQASWPQELSDPLESIQGQLLSCDPDARWSAILNLSHEGSSDWLTHPQIVERLQSLAADPAEKPEMRGAILWEFQMAKAFDRIRPLAVYLAGDESDPIMAREAAQVISFDAYDSGGSNGIEGLFLASAGIQQQETAITIGTQFPKLSGAGVEEAVVAELISIFMDDDLSPETRGRAIEAGGAFSRDDTMADALIEMLRPENWFFGAPAEHYLVHSVAATIGALYGAQSPRLRQELQSVCHALDRIPENQRWDVEVELRINAEKHAWILCLAAYRD